MRLAALILALSIAQAQAQPAQQAAARPDFSGEWTLDTRPVPTMKGTRAAMLGERFIAKQDAKTLTLAITAYGRSFDAVYNLDGSDSKLVSPTSPGQPDEVIISHATWEGDRLVIRTTTMELSDGKQVEMTTRRVMWIDARGVLLLDRTGTPPELVSPSTSAYRRVK